MKVTFVHLGRENLGIEYLSGALKRNGHQTALAYDPGLFGPEDNVFRVPSLERLFSEKEKVIAGIERTRPDMLAFSAYTSTYPWACGVARAVRERMNVKTVFGGTHATLVPERVIENEFVDFVIVGEGEGALCELADALAHNRETEGIGNLWFKKRGTIIKNGLRPPIENLDALPFPDKELFEKDVNYRDDYVIMTSRGCVGDCSYCCESFMNRLYHKRFYRRRSVDSVMEELKVMKERYDFREVMFFDAFFTTQKAWLSDLMTRYKKEIAVPFRCLGKVNFFDEEIGTLLKESGCYCVDFGMQTTNERIKRDVLNRSETNEQAMRTFGLCDRLKLRYDIDHMFGLPHETEEDHVAGARMYNGLKYVNRIKCFQLTYFPKMEITESAREAGLLNEKDIGDITEGRIGDFFHSDSLKGDPLAKINRGFKAFYKFLPLVPPAFVRYILAHRRYRAFAFMPSCVIIFLQILVAIRGRDYRYIFYVKYYLLRIGRRCAKA
jgi:anaerobic magnesium-protoporphyrin IX monomethyl ester cyclase